MTKNFWTSSVIKANKTLFILLFEKYTQNNAKQEKKMQIILGFYSKCISYRKKKTSKLFYRSRCDKKKDELRMI